MKCIYCRSDLTPIGTINRKTASWEHIANDIDVIKLGNIERRCVGCIAGKGTKTRSKWLNSTYCRNYNISESTLALVAIEALRRERKADGEDDTTA